MKIALLVYLEKKNNILDYQCVYFDRLSEYSIFKDRKILLSYLYSVSIPKRLSYKFIIDNSYPSTDLFVLYINGILTNEYLILNTQQILRDYLKNNINCFFIPTQSFPVDILKCISKKLEFSNPLIEEIMTIIISTLNKKNFSKIIIISHSNACFLISRILDLMKELKFDSDYLSSIEIYCIGSPADKFKYIQDSYPYIEHIYNQYDTVSNFGIGNSYNDLQSLIEIDGKLICLNNRYGHLINEHYLNYIFTKEGETEMINKNSSFINYKNYGEKYHKVIVKKNKNLINLIYNKIIFFFLSSWYCKFM